MRKHWMVAVLILGMLTACAATGPTANAPADTSVPVTSPAATLSTAGTLGLQPTATAIAATSPAGTPSRAQASPTFARTLPATGSVTATTVPATTPAATRVVAPSGQITLPAGFGISVFAGGLNTPRNIAIGTDGYLYVAERGAGRIVRLADRNHDGVSDGVEVISQGFDRPSSLAFHPDGSLYVSTSTQVFRLSQPNANGVYQRRDVLIDGLSGPQDHFTRTLLFSPDGSALFIQIGSSCNVCKENDARRATIMRFNADGSGGAIYASGLRNAVGITFRLGTNELWATNNSTDDLGDNVPPDTIQIVQQGQDYGWPRCHAGTIVDPQYGGPGACSGVAAPLVSIQAHSAALGLTFYTGTRFPAEYRGDLYVVLHGSIYRSLPTGYKVVRVHLSNGRPAGSVQDFAAGWLLASGKEWGRPADVLLAPDGSLFVSDDSGGIIYRIFYAGS
jgi:glucose/arabinose dehydrogenase